MQFFELVKARRSIRKFEKGKVVSDEQIEKILDAGIWAPSAGNTQCWRFLVVRDLKAKEDLAIQAAHQQFIADSSVLIVVCADLNHIGNSYGGRGRDTYALQDTAAAVENMLLAITDLGLASCWIGAFDEGKAAHILKLGEGIRPLAILPIGYSGMESRAPKRRNLADVVTKI